MVEILYDREFSRDDLDYDPLPDDDDGGFSTRYERKLSDPLERERVALRTRYGSLDRRPWARDDVISGTRAADLVERREYGSLDRRARSQILTRWTSPPEDDDVIFETRRHRRHLSSSGSEANFLSRGQTLYSRSPAAAAEESYLIHPSSKFLQQQQQQQQYWSLPRHAQFKAKLSDSDVTPHDAVPQRMRTDSAFPAPQPNAVEWSLPRNFRLNKSEGITHHI